ncbi:hypothetical protein FIBSPDRAFT_751237, partial [Athelia psychrophila]
WEHERDHYLDELMGLEGRGRFQSACAGCIQTQPAYRCKDCVHGALWCQDCVVHEHRLNPLHVVEKWNGMFFEKTSLRSLGLRVRLGHAPGRYCKTKKQGNKDFVVIHTNRIHTINLEFCRCTDVKWHTQLLRYGWYPSTPTKPQTCATMEVLRQFHYMNLQGKLSAFSFYRALEYMSDSTGLHPPPDRLPAFVLMVRQWRHLKLLKRAGRAYDPDGVNATQPGELAMQCRACPIPGVNLPTGWENTPPDKVWKYMLTLAMDANFRLKSKLRGLVTDPSLSPGWAYFVDHVPYSKFVAEAADDEDVSTRSCVGFQALLNMLTKSSKGLRATGMGAVSCARHQLFRPQGMGDLQKGERYANMDFIFASSVGKVGLGLKMIALSYDVGCHWIKRAFIRLPLLPERVRVAFKKLPGSHGAAIYLQALVPKFHLQSHNEKCHSAFSFNFARGGGRTDGEGVERNWAELNGQAASTAEMLPGHRWETLDDCCGWANWRKTMGLGNLLLKRLILAIGLAVETRNDFRRFHTSLQTENPTELAAMEAELAAWEIDHDKPDPYLLPKSNVTLERLRLVMAEEEKLRAEVGTSLMYDVSAGSFLLLALDIQKTQQAIRTEAKGKRNSTLLQTTSIVERRTTLVKRVHRFREIQKLYMPKFDPLSHADLTAAPCQIEDCVLYLPSELSASDRRKFCPNGLPDLEDRIRYAEACDSLENLRHHLRTRSFANRFKVANTTGQINNTRAREAQARIDDKVHTFAVQYRRARAALLVLRAGKDKRWQDKLAPLLQSDVRALNERELTQQEKDEMRSAAASVGEGHRKPSWIWYTGVRQEELDDPMTRKALRVEWAKAGARGDRWEEEVVTLDGEMGRVLEYCGWKHDWWKCQTQRRLPDLQLERDKTLREGLSAYAEQQAHMESTLASIWEQKWMTVRVRAAPIVEGNTPGELLEDDDVMDTDETIELIDDYNDEPELDY